MIYPEPEALQDFNLHKYCILFVPFSVMDGYSVLMKWTASVN